MALAQVFKILRFALVTKFCNFPISRREASLIQMVGISIAILTPARVGEGSKAVLLNKRLNIPIAESLGIVIFERFFDLILLGSGAIIFSFYMLQSRITLFLAIFILCVFVLFLVFMKSFDRVKKMISRRHLEYFKDINYKDKKTLFLSIFIITVFAWLSQATLPWLFALSINVKIPFSSVFSIMCISTIAVVFSILPAGIGTLDLSFVMLYSMIGISKETAVSILLIYRFFAITLPFLFALFFINYYGTSIKEFKNI
jgi:uncharacterized membrane protein YbhN (UPF0104 family)